MSIQQHALPYHPDSTRLFNCFANESWAILLDSGARHDKKFSRYDIIVARPYTTITTQSGLTTISKDDKSITSDKDPFMLVKDEVGVIKAEISHSLPFIGGAVGYFGYELNHHDQLPKSSDKETPIADMQVGIYDWAVIVDHHQKQTTLVSAFHHPQTRFIWSSLIKELEQPVVAATGEYFTSASDTNTSFSSGSYNNAFNKIQHYLHDGDCYQVNLTQRFDVEVSGNSWDIYRSIREQNPAPFSAFLNLPESEVVSFSPERFLQVKDGHVETKPIKGTRPRGKTTAEDEQLRLSLLNSDKDRAENLMIVDLLRNDISKSCKIGSVRVPRLFALESYENVHHLVSTIVGELKDTCNALDLLKDAFPGGSITGAPKIRAMEIIDELEPVARSLYCGSIGYIDYFGNMDTNIAIRSAYRKGNRLFFHAGGGIITDSHAEDEYKELHDKASFFIDFCNNHNKQLKQKNDH